MGMIQIAVLGVTGALLAVQFKNGKSEYGVYISIALCVMVFFSIMDRVGVVIFAIRDLSNQVLVKNGYLAILLKMLGVAYVAEFASSICKDAGHQTIAGQIEVYSKIAILAISMPVLKTLLETIGAFLG